jgi:hypothetical protein
MGWREVTNPLNILTIALLIQQGKLLESTSRNRLKYCPQTLSLTVIYIYTYCCRLFPSFCELRYVSFLVRLAGYVFQGAVCYRISVPDQSKGRAEGAVRQASVAGR